MFSSTVERCTIVLLQLYLLNCSRVYNVLYCTNLSFIFKLPLLVEIDFRLISVFPKTIMAIYFYYDQNFFLGFSDSKYLVFSLKYGDMVKKTPQFIVANVFNFYLDYD